MQDRWRKFVVPAAAGMLLVPAAAIAGARMLVTEPSNAPSVAELEMADAGTDDDRLATACGPEAADLVSRETAGTIDPIGQAALDALRPICEQAGQPLPPAPVPDPIVVEERIEIPVAVTPLAMVAAAPAGLSPGSVGQPPTTADHGGRSDDDHDDDQDDDHDDERDDDHEDHDRDDDDHDDDRDDDHDDHDRDDDRDDDHDDDHDDDRDDDRDDDEDDE